MRSIDEERMLDQITHQVNESLERFIGEESPIATSELYRSISKALQDLANAPGFRSNFTPSAQPSPSAIAALARQIQGKPHEWTFNEQGEPGISIVEPLAIDSFEVTINVNAPSVLA